MTTTQTKHSAREIAQAFAKLGVTSFGGPAAHLGYFRDEFVERRQWLNDSQYSQLVALAQLLPGPASSQVGFALGLLRAGWLGGLCAFLAFTLPSILLMVGAAHALGFNSNVLVYWVIHGLKLAAVAVVAHALVGMLKQFCTTPATIAIMLAGLAGMLFISLPFMQLVVIALGGVLGWLFCKEATLVSTDVPQPSYTSRLGVRLLVVFALLLIALPLVTTVLPDSSLAVFDHFYRTGALVFGGGHVVLPLLQDGVTQHGWLSNNQFLAGYGAAQSLPGPLFSIAAYIGWLLPDGMGGITGVCITIAAIFLPGFLLMAGALPLWREASASPQWMRPLAAVVPGINAAVVGLLGAALVDPLVTSTIAGWPDIGVALIAFAFLYWMKLSPLLVVVWCVAVSLMFGQL